MRRIAVILAGGAGERFWPLSREARPKQLLRLTDPNRTMLEEAIRRIEPLVGEENVAVAIGRTLETPVRNAGLLSPERLWVEPVRRNTLGAIVWATAHVLAEHPEEDVSMAFLTADHKIGEPGAFLEAVQVALEIAESQDALVTLGLRPSRPETGYGYIEIEPGSQGPTQSKSFREKPGHVQAAAFVESGNFLWNSGMFFWRVSTLLRELERALPEAHAAVWEIAEALRAEDTGKASALFETLPSVSIDYALLEKAERVFVVPAAFTWDDVGAWDALTRTLPLDPDGNASVGNVTALETRGSVLYSDDPNLRLCVLGMEEIVVVHTGDALLVCAKKDAQRVRELVARLREEGSADHLL